MSVNTGKPYEKLTGVVFQWIVNQSDVRNIKVKHNIKLPGKNRNSHRIDIYWKFAVDCVEYETVVEAKDWRNPVDQGELRKFKGLLDDLPGQPRGIFVSRAGYQQGARDFARTHGILIYELREADCPPPVSIPVTGWARYWIIGMPVRGIIRAAEEDTPNNVRVLGVVWDVFAPEFSNIHFEPSASWLSSEYPTTNFDKIESVKLPTAFLHKIQLYDEGRAGTGNLGVIFRELAQAMNNDGVKQKRATHVFQQPTLIQTDSPSFPYIKIDAVSVDVNIEHRQEISRGRKADFAEWVLRELNSGKTDWFLATPSATSLLPTRSDS